MRFQFSQPESLEEAISLLTQHPTESKVMAGGTDLLVAIKSRKLSAPYIIGLSRINRLSEVANDPHANSLRIGALATLHEVSSSPAARERFSPLADASSSVGSRQIRNLGTVAGNICNASPSADTAPALLALEAMVSIVGPRGKRKVALADFFKGPGSTAVGGDEIVDELLVPDPGPDAVGVYKKLGHRRAMDLAIVGVAALMCVRDGICHKARLALGAVAPTPIRVPEAESVLTNQAIDDQLLERASQAAMEACHPISDVRASAEYRREMVGVLVKRAIREAMARNSN